MSDRLIPTKPGWWWSSVGGFSRRPHDIRAEDETGRLFAVTRTIESAQGDYPWVDDSRIDWIAPVLEPGEILALQQQARNEKQAAIVAYLRRVAGDGNDAQSQTLRYHAQIIEDGAAE